MTVSTTRKERFLTSLAETGRILESCATSGISYRSVHRWRKNDEEFRLRFEEAELLYCEKIEREIERRAIDGWDEPVFQNGEQVGSKRRYSDSLLLALTRSRIARYRDKVEVEATHKGSVLVVPAPALSEEAFDELVRADKP